MYSKISMFITNILLNNKSIDEEYFEVYSFGLEKMVSNFFGIFFLLLATIILSAPLEALVFYFAFKYMRIYSGGYHAKTYTKCNIIYILTFSFAVILSRNIDTFEILIIFGVITLLTIIILSPIESPNNPILVNQYYRYYFYSLTIVILLNILQIIFIILKIELYNILSVTMFLAVVFMWVEIFNRRRNKPMSGVKKKICDLIAKKASKNAINTTREVSYYRMHQPKIPEKLKQFIQK